MLNDPDETLYYEQVVHADELKEKAPPRPILGVKKVDQNGWQPSAGLQAIGLFI